MMKQIVIKITHCSMCPNYRTTTGHVHPAYQPYCIKFGDSKARPFHNPKYRFGALLSMDPNREILPNCPLDNYDQKGRRYL